MLSELLSSTLLSNNLSISIKSKYWGSFGNVDAISLFDSISLFNNNSKSAVVLLLNKDIKIW